MELDVLSQSQNYHHKQILLNSSRPLLKLSLPSSNDHFHYRKNHRQSLSLFQIFEYRQFHYAYNIYEEHQLLSKKVESKVNLFEKRELALLLLQ